jgi:hypothetical protein
MSATSIESRSIAEVQQVQILTLSCDPFLAHDAGVKVLEIKRPVFNVCYQ